MVAFVRITNLNIYENIMNINENTKKSNKNTNNHVKSNSLTKPECTERTKVWLHNALNITEQNDLSLGQCILHKLL